YISPYHPPSNACERANKTVRTMMAMAIDQKDQVNWVEQLPAIELAMRTAINESTGYSPAELYLGRMLKLPIDNILQQMKDESEQESEFKTLGLKEKFSLAANRIAESQ